MENTMSNLDENKTPLQASWSEGYAAGYLAGLRHSHGAFNMAIDAEFNEAHKNWWIRTDWAQIDVVEHCRKLARHAIKQRVTAQLP
jgi:hypothetical protein